MSRTPPRELSFPEQVAKTVEWLRKAKTLSEIHNIEGFLQKHKQIAGEAEVHAAFEETVVEVCCSHISEADSIRRMKQVQPILQRHNLGDHPSIEETILEATSRLNQQEAEEVEF